MWLTYLLMGCALLVALAGCASQKSSREPSPPGPITYPPSASSTQPTKDIWAPVYTGSAGFVNANATWQRPAALTVEHSEKIGLAIGQSQALTSKITGLLPDTIASPGGQVTVGPFVRARLEANSADADVVPSDMVNESTERDVSLLWTWIVHPNRPTSSLVLIAHVEVPLTGSTNVLSTDVPLNIRVDGTFSYWFGRFMSNWATWFPPAIVIALVGAAAGFFRRWRRKDLPPEPPRATHVP
jgi:hypothetical protein